MANATININAVDNTRAAFLGVQRGLQRVRGEAQKTAKGLLTPLTGAGLGAGLGAALGVNLRSIGEGVARLITGVTKEAEAALQSLATVSGQVADITQARIRSMRTQEQQIEYLKTREMRAINEIAELQQLKSQAAERGRLEVLKNRLMANKFGKQEVLETEQILERIVQAELRLNQAVAEREGLQGRGAPSKQLLEQYQDALRAAGTPNKALPITEQLEGLRATQGRLMADLAKIPESEINTKIGMESAIPLLKDLAKVNDQVTRAMEEQRRVAKEAASILAGGFEEAVFSGEKLSKVISQLGKDILRLMFRNMITDKLANFFTGGLSKIFGFADGGLPPANRPSIVGERGPELFVPGTSGRIVPNHELTGGGKGGGATYYIDARGADQTGLARLENMIRQTQASIRPIALSSVMDARMRQPRFA
jgi:ATP:corrinoid adenosyltransferase